MGFEPSFTLLVLTGPKVILYPSGSSYFDCHELCLTTWEISTVVFSILQKYWSCDQGNIFTPVCLPVHRGRSVLVHPGIPPLGSRHPHSRHTPPGSRHPLPPGADTPSMRYQAVSPHGVRSGLGRQTPFGVPVFAPGWGQSGVNIRAQGVSPCIGIII